MLSKISLILPIMNFIELLFHLKLEKYTFSKLSDKEVIKIEKIILAEKSISENIDNYDVEKLLLAIKKYPKELDKLLKKTEFLFMFTGDQKIPSIESNTSLADESEVTFFDEILKEDFEIAFYKRMSKNDYKSLNNLMQYSKMFSFEFLYDLENKLTEKIRGANRFFRDKNFRNSKEYNFIKHSGFFALISHFPNEDVENAILSLYNKVVDAYNEFRHKPAKFALECLVSFSYFRSTNEAFAETLKGNKQIALDMMRSGQFASDNKPKHESKVRRKLREIPWLAYFLAFIFIRIGISAFNDSSNDYKPNSVSFNKNFEKVKTEFTEKQYEKEQLFYDYLSYTDSLELEEKFIEKVTNVSSGILTSEQDPSEFDLTNEMLVPFFNNTKFDLIAIKYLNFGHFYQYKQSYFISSKDSINISVRKKRNLGLPYTYVLYFGNDLAKFKTNDNEKRTKLILKNISEYEELKFIKRPLFTREILNHHFEFYNEVSLGVYNSNELNVISPNMIYYDSKGEEITNSSMAFFPLQ